jgi:hypothetical protein
MNGFSACGYDTRKEAVNKWNTRQPDTELVTALRKIAGLEQSYCGRGASIARITSCGKMRELAIEALAKHKENGVRLEGK